MTDRPFELNLARTLNAPVARVWDLCADNEHRKHWWGPKNWTCTHTESDFRVGGAWRACIVSPAGNENWMSGAYQDIVPNKRIVFTFSWEQNETGEGVDTLITVTFAEQNGKTVQTFHQAAFRTEAGRDRHIGGWNEFLDRETAYLESGQ